MLFHRVSCCLLPFGLKGVVASRQPLVMFFAMIVSSQAGMAVLCLCTFAMGVLTGWLVARRPASPSRPGQDPSQTSGTSMPDSTSEIGTPAAGSHMLRRRVRAQNRQYHIKPGSASATCRHTSLAVTATNQWSWAVRCPDCQLRLSVWWLTGEDHRNMSQADMLNIAKDIVQ